MFEVQVSGKDLTDNLQAALFMGPGVGIVLGGVGAP